MRCPTVRIIDDGPQPFPVVIAEYASAMGAITESTLAVAEAVFERFFEAFPDLRQRPFDWRRDDPEDFERHFPPLVFGGRGVVLTDDVLEEVRTRLHRRLAAGDVDSGLWARS